MPAFPALKDMRDTGPKRTLGLALSEHMPRRLTEMLAKRLTLPIETRLADLSNKALEEAAAALSNWAFKPTGTEGWRTAEVTAGGVATDGLSSKPPGNMSLLKTKIGASHDRPSRCLHPDALWR